MGILIDIFLVSILALNIYFGYKKGLIKVVFSICAFVIALIATLILFKPVSDAIKDNTHLDENIKQIIIEKNQKEIEKEEVFANNEKTTIQKYIEKYVKDTTDTAKAEAMEILARNISEYAVNLIVGITIFIGIRIVLIFLKFMADSISKLPIIKQFNKAGGLIYGLIKGILIIYIILTILFFVVSVNGTGIIAESINSSYITKFLFQNNFFVGFYK